MISSSNNLLMAGCVSILATVVASSAMAAGSGLARDGAGQRPLQAAAGHDRHFRPWHWHHRHRQDRPDFYEPAISPEEPARAGPNDSRSMGSHDSPPDRAPVFSPIQPEMPVAPPVAQVTFPAKIIELRACGAHRSCPRHFTRASAHVLAR